MAVKAPTKSKKAPSRPQLDWAVEQARVTIFGNLPSLNLRSFEELAGEPPHSHNSQPQLQVVQEAGRLASRDSAVLTIARQSTRADLVLQARPRLDIANLPSLGSLPEIIRLISELFDGWFDRKSDITRLAVSATIVSIAPDLDVAKRRLAGFLPSFHWKEPIDDFVLQINRPRNSKTVSTLRINRLCQWQAAVIGAVVGQPNGLVALPFLPSFGLTPVCQCLADINTDGLNSRIGADDILPLFTEMTAYIEEISQKGDLP